MVGFGVPFHLLRQKLGLRGSFLPLLLVLFVLRQVSHQLDLLRRRTCLGQ